MIVVLILYGLAVAGLLLYAGQCAWLCAVFLRHRHDPPPGQGSRSAPSPAGRTPSPSDDPNPVGPPAALPSVTVQLPIYNERFVVRRLLHAVGSIDWPADRLQIQVLDDSTDDTSERIAEVLAELRERGLDVQHLQRTDRRGFKAGALAAGTALAKGELLAIFDADFLPAPDVLRRMVPAFEDPRVGFVQARWEHLDRDHSWLTRAQALAVDGHFGVEQAARSRGGFLLNFNGTAGIWRRAAIDAAGGWTADTLTEDLDLSYRAQLAGWRGEYLMDVGVPAELPADMSAFKSQQRRWAQGSIQTAMRLLPAVWAAPLSARVKLQATLHLTHYMVHPLMLTVALVAPFVLGAAGRADLGRPLVIAGALAMLAGTAAPNAMYLLGQRVLGRSRWHSLADLPRLMALGSGLSVSNSLAVAAALAGRRGRFVRTPKSSLVDGGRPPAAARAYRLPNDVTPVIEALLAAWSCLGLTLALSSSSWPVLPFLSLYVVGFSVVAWCTAREALERMLAQRNLRGQQRTSKAGPPTRPGRASLLPPETSL